MGTSIEIPQAIQSEKAVIGAIVSGGRESIKKIQHLVTKDDFYDKKHSIIYRAASYLMQRDKDIDIISLHDFLERKGYIDTIGGSAYLAETTMEYVGDHMIVAHAKIIADRATARRIIKASQDIIASANDVEDMDKFVYESEQRLKGVTKNSARKESRHAIVDLEEWRKIARDVQPTPGGLRGMSLGYRKLDDMTEGFEGGEVMVLTGYTKHGKSKLAANIAWNVASRGDDVMFINTEMTKLQVARRMNGMTRDSSATPGKIYVNDRADLEAFDVTAIMERAKEMGCKLVIIDHLHFFSRSADNQANEISKITKEFKEAAVQLDLPVILLCHVKHGDTTKRPTLEALKGSSSIAQDADIVLAVWRDDRPNATDPFKTEVMRLAHRSAERAITHIEMFGEGIRLLEERPPTTEQQRQWVEDTEKILGDNETKKVTAW